MKVATLWSERNVLLEIDPEALGLRTNLIYFSTGQKAFKILPSTHLLSTAACDLLSTPTPITSVSYVKKN